MFTILHVAALKRNEIGGPQAVVPCLVAAQNRLPGVTAGLLNTLSPLPFRRPDLAVFHGTYVPAYARIARRLAAAGVPYIICPHGGMTRFAQRTRWWKKRIANLWFFNRMVAGAAALHCLTVGEAAATRGWQRPIFVVGNGVSTSPLPPCGRGAGGEGGGEMDGLLQSELPSPLTPLPRAGEGNLRLLFLGRLEIKIKGLDLLLDACALIADELRRRDVVVDLYGPDFHGSARTLAGRIAALGLGDVVRLHGPVVGDAKEAVFRQADVFLHPSRSEGHPMAVLEALAHGLPCVLTPNTNMADEVAAAGAGWRVEPTPAGIAAGLRAVLAVPREHLAAIGRAARQLVEREYDWETIAARTVAEYRRFLDPAPTCPAPRNSRWLTAAGGTRH